MFFIRWLRSERGFSAEENLLGFHVTSGEQLGESLVGSTDLIVGLLVVLIERVSRIHTVVVVCEKAAGRSDLLDVRQHLRLRAFDLDLAEHWQCDASEDGDDRDHDEQFDERECGLSFGR